VSPLVPCPIDFVLFVSGIHDIRRSVSDLISIFSVLSLVSIIVRLLHHFGDLCAFPASRGWPVYSPVCELAHELPEGQSEELVHRDSN
jgi:hypothetical protein